MSLDTWVEEQRELFGIPGLAVGVIHEGKAVLSQGLGLRDVDGQLPVTPDTAFAIASVTKAFTAAGVGALVDDGLLEWDRPVREYIPNFQMYDHVATECITPRDFLCHRSGVPRHDGVWYGGVDITRIDLVNSLRWLQPSKSFRSTWQYNNLMYVTAGYLCEVVTGRTWEELIRERLFDLARMSASSFSYEDSGVDGNVALPYAKRKGQVARIPYAAAKDVVSPAGAIYSTLTDMMSWLAVNLDGGMLGDDRVLSEDTVRELLAPQMVIPEELQIFPEVNEHSYGLGWQIGDYRGHKFVRHGGNTDGFTSLVAMLPEERVGVVLLCNRQETLSRAAIAFHIFDELLGLEPLPWSERLKEREDAAGAGVKEAKSRADRVQGTTPSHPLEDYVGEYEHPAYRKFAVEVLDGELRARFRHLKAHLVHRHYDTFDVETEEFEFSQLSASFVTSPDGRVSAVLVPFEPTVDPIVFARAPESMPPADVCEKLAGTYAMGPVEITIEFAPPNRLTARVQGMGSFRLLPDGGLKFKVEGQQGASAHFDLGEDGLPRELVLQPLGVFYPKTSTP